MTDQETRVLASNLALLVVMMLRHKDHASVAYEVQRLCDCDADAKAAIEKARKELNQ